MGQTYKNSTRTNRDCEVNFVRPPSSDDKTGLELSGLHEIEHCRAEK